MEQTEKYKKLLKVVKKELDSKQITVSYRQSYTKEARFDTNGYMLDPSLGNRQTTELRKALIKVSEKVRKAGYPIYTNNMTNGQFFFVVKNL